MNMIEPQPWLNVPTNNFKSNEIWLLGQPPLELDVQHPPRAYAGWIPLHLVVQVPLVCPHWHAVEGYQFLERLLVAVPDAYALDVEDIQESKDAEAGPFTWSRPRWAGRSDLPRNGVSIISPSRRT